MEVLHLEAAWLEVVKMDINKKTLVLWILIAVLLISVVYVLFLKGSTSSATNVASSAAQVATSSGMVGGC